METPVVLPSHVSTARTCAEGVSSQCPHAPNAITIQLIRLITCLARLLPSLEIRTARQIWQVVLEYLPTRYLGQVHRASVPTYRAGPLKAARQ